MDPDARAFLAAMLLAFVLGVVVGGTAVIAVLFL